MSSVAVSIRGKVRDLGHDKIPELFKKNPYMHQIYPTEESMKALTVFQIYEGTGEWFDLSKKPIICLSPELYHYYQDSVCHRAGTLSALW